MGGNMQLGTPRTSLRRTAVGFGLALLILFTALSPLNAHAADDSIDTWTIVYTINPSGTIHAEETITYRFGDNSGRHGIDRTFVIREQWADTNQDAIYTITNITVTSPDAVADFKTETLGAGRDQQLRVRIGSPNLTVPTPTATYHITYDLAGALRSTITPEASYDEFYWNAIGDATPRVADTQITVSIPGFVQDVRCYTGKLGATTPCTVATITPVGKAVFIQSDKPPGAFVTIAVKIPPGIVDDNQPNLVRRAIDLAGNGGPFSVALAVLTFLAVPRLARRANRDDRYRAAPGTLADAPIHPDNNPIIPVQFIPPDIPVADAGFIDDGATEVRDLTATLLSLATRGVITLREVKKAKSNKTKTKGKPDKPSYNILATLVDASIDVSDAETKLLAALFPRLEKGEEQHLSGRSRLTELYDALQQDVRHQVQAAGWYKRMPEKGLTEEEVGYEGATGEVLGRIIVSIPVFGIATLMWSALFEASFDKWWPVWLSLVVLTMGFMVYRARTRSGRRSALGRAYADQVQGFREYLATAEADQIRFEEGQDIFGEYLPWAVIFDLTKRWVNICQKLVAEGRLAALSPTWYDGSERSFDAGTFSMSIRNVTRSATPVTPASSSSSSSGSGGGSSFSDSGGSSGGGGGGGGASSW